MSKLYGISCLALNTYSIIIENSYVTKEDAYKNLKKDAKNFMVKHHSGSKIRSIYKKKSIKDNVESDGFYLKVSNKNVGNVNVYQKETIVNAGYLYNSKELKIKKSYIFSIVEIPAPTKLELGVSIPLSCEAILSNYMFDNQIKTAKQEQDDSIKNQHDDNNGQDYFIKELKEYLANRRKSITGKQ
jgi:hypothetical protein